MKNKRLNLGTGAIGPLLLKMSLPAITANVVVAFYNLLDVFWLSRIGPKAVAALTVCFPIQILLAAIGIGTGVGAASFGARMFGAGQTDRAEKVAGQAVFLSAVLGIVVLVSCEIFTEPILRLFGATDDILPLSKMYLTTYIVCAPFMFFTMMGNNILRAEGNPNPAMFVIFVLACTGAVLDPILIFGLGPFPEMGIKGAGYAAVCAYFLSALLCFIFFMSDRSGYQMSRRNLVPDLSLILSVYRVGFPAFIMNLSVSVVITVYNHVLGGFGAQAVATFGIIFRLNGIIIFLLFGIGHGVLPMVGFNYGAGLYERLRQTVRTAVRWSVAIAGMSILLALLFAEHIVAVFTSDHSLLTIAMPAMRIYVTALIFLGPAIIAINMFNGLGMGFTATSLLFFRDLFVLIPFLIFVAPRIGLNAVWCAHPLSNLFLIVISWLWTRMLFKKLG
ncbi:MAG TPA: MATE family efflux transporter [Deltaproteobacteria bacterium]|nr:MATE family efflux transporter [Deltaproteobacteria bacterium]